ncbi:MAG: hypothetical protein HY043_02735 [Verrucomicrobia bacterium]|nr:hypothetical protein [Verrucomicrobiota bacterium]
MNFELLAATALDPEAVAGGLGAVLVLVLGILALVISIVWIIFPFLVIAKMNEQLKELNHLRAEMDMARLELLKLLRSSLDAIATTEKGDSEITKAQLDAANTWHQRADTLLEAIEKNTRGT